MNVTTFQQAILEGIPANLPLIQDYNQLVSHAPNRVIEGVLSDEEKKLALKTSLEKHYHSTTKSCPNN